MMQEIYKKIWTLSPFVHDRKSYCELTKLTEQLIKLYDEQGRLQVDPFHSARERTINLPFDKIQEELKGSVCIVTGGLGCVGAMLVKELLQFKVKTIIILDIQPNKQFIDCEKVINLSCDIRDLQSVQKIFAAYHPNFVFHAAAQHDPGYAETHISETVSTNVLGTLNIVKASETIKTVKQLVFSSTGKASRYYTEEVYAGTKKICEFVIDAYAREGNVKYTMVRFTHIIDNSLMDMQLEAASKNDEYVALHSPGKYVTAQNAREAAHLMLNALICSEQKQSTLLLTRNLEWPVESLEVALYHIKKAGRSIPVVFVGNPIGYSEKFFRGQIDWTRPNEINLLINVYEGKHLWLNRTRDIILSRICPTDKNTLDKTLDKISHARGEEKIKEALVEGLRSLVREVLRMVDKEETVDILHWGLEQKFLAMENTSPSDFKVIISMLIESLNGSEYHKEIEELVYHNA